LYPRYLSEAYPDNKFICDSIAIFGAPVVPEVTPKKAIEFPFGSSFSTKISSSFIPYLTKSEKT